MNSPVRFPFTNAKSRQTAVGQLAYLPITLSHEMYSMPVSGLLDTGSTVNVMPYSVGLKLGFVWEQQTTLVRLTGNLANDVAKAVVVSGQIASLPPTALVFAWTQAEEIPVILGQMNFFTEFDVCFFGSQAAFEISLKSR